MLEDVVEGYVSIGRARVDYGVVVIEIDAELSCFEVEEEETAAERGRIRAARRGWLEEDPEAVAVRYRAGELVDLDVVRRHGVILDWGSGEVLAQSTREYRELLRARAAGAWVE